MEARRPEPIPDPRDGVGPRETVEPRSSVRLPALVRLARPKQWLKNILVVAAPGAAGVLGQPKALFQTAVAFVCFCLAASGTYYLNDAIDAPADRLHPAKRLRPVAAGMVSQQTATIGGIVSLVVMSVMIDRFTRLRVEAQTAELEFQG